MHLTLQMHFGGQLAPSGETPPVFFHVVLFLLNSLDFSLDARLYVAQIRNTKHCKYH
jgi:hypothetical protein